MTHSQPSALVHGGSSIGGGEGADRAAVMPAWPVVIAPLPARVLRRNCRRMTWRPSASPFHLVPPCAAYAQVTGPDKPSSDLPIVNKSVTGPTRSFQWTSRFRNREPPFFIQDAAAHPSGARCPPRRDRFLTRAVDHRGWRGSVIGPRRARLGVSLGG